MSGTPFHAPDAAAGRSDPRAVAIRPITPDDVPAVWTLVLEFASYVKLAHLATGSAGRLESHLFGGAWPRLDGVLAEDAGALVGYALWFGTFSSFRAQPMLFLEDLYVSPSHRGTGAGLALFQAVAREAVERGCSSMRWGVLRWNEGAVRFYERLGATRVEEDEHAFQLEPEPLAALVRMRVPSH